MLCLLPLLLLASGCNTVAPKPVEQSQASFDIVPDATGNYQNSGLLGVTNHLFIITPSLMARYNALIKLYGNQFTPKLNWGVGITLSNGNILMDKAHMSDLLEMVQWELNPEIAPK